MALSTHAHPPHMPRSTTHAAYDLSAGEFRSTSNSNSWDHSNTAYDTESYQTHWPSIFSAPSESIYTFDGSYHMPAQTETPSATPPFEYRCNISTVSRSPSSSSYPESSQRTDIPPSTYPNQIRGIVDPLPTPPLISPPLRTSPPRWDEGLLTLDPDCGAVDDHTASTFVVKSEPEDSFILEMGTENLTAPPVISFTPMTAPLRATHASADMRKLMGVFRLDPFTMLNGVRGSPRAWQYGPDAEVGPLEEEPIMFEFQLELDQPLIPATPTGSRGSSPSYSKEESVAASYRGSYFDRYNDAQKSDIDSGSSNCSQYGVGAGMYTLSEAPPSGSFTFTPGPTSRTEAFTQDLSLQAPSRPLSQPAYQPSVPYSETQPYTPYYGYQSIEEYRSGLSYAYTPSATEGTDLPCHSSMARRWSLPQGA
ncbi:hypothetical protein BD410DRAFT_837393 [Rickenella mellea]|uniref:Uncharacterized protein n=1 Tax=Rickenella mellea TaxID=50990 RepID=A0A4Y7QBW0_9AGAM|nr:hypothetical protein BD410DRAFT_837393 [Rickenella mellea]